MNILVTGGNGQLGSELKELELKFPKYNFYFSDIDTLDITNEAEVLSFMEKIQPDFVVNCAAYTAVDKAETEAEMAWQVNAVAPGILGRASKTVGARIIHVSTDYVFSGNRNQPYSEDEKTDPTSVYGTTKLQGELNCVKENRDAVIVRTSWLYSEFGNNFVNTMLRFGKERDFVKVVFDQVGTPTYAGDLAIAILTIIEKCDSKPESFVPGVYHYSNEGAISWYDFAKAIFELKEIDCDVFPIFSKEFPTPVKRPAYSVLNKSKIKDIFEISIPYWKDSLRVCLNNIENL